MKAYVYQADLYCEGCANKKQSQLDQDKNIMWFRDSDHYPQGPYADGGGEADTPQHCDTCGLFLENPLTDDGEMYVNQAYEEFPDSGNLETINQWVTFYDYLNLANIGEGPY